MSREAEQSVLGALLLDSDSLSRVPGLRSVHFAEGRHRRIMVAILSQAAAGRMFDAITIHGAVGGDDEMLGYLQAMAQAVPSARHVDRYAEMVMEAAAHRALRELAESVAEIAASEGSAKDKADRIGALMGALKVNEKRAPRRLGELAMARTEHYEALQAGEKSPGILTHIPGLDRRLGGGLKPGKLVILAARPSVGKTSFALQIARWLGANGAPGLFLSQEMESGEIVDRAVSSEARIDGQAIAMGTMTQDDWGRAVDALGAMADHPVWIDDQPALSLLDIRSKARAIPGIKWLVVDYLQLCSSTLKRESRTAQVGEISRGLKELSKELGITVIALSQLNRDVEKRNPPRPILADLRDSGEIEQDADQVLFLYPLVKADMSPDGCARVALECAKVRGGQTGDMVLRFEGSVQRWTESIERVSDFASKRNNRGDDL